MKFASFFAGLIIAAGFFAMLGVTASAQNSPVEPSAAKPHEVNITTDSAPGWLPSSDQEQQVLKKSADFFSALDSEDYQRAYAMMTQANRNLQPLPQFIQENHQFHERSGPMTGRNVLKVTWTKDPAAAPFPGVYAAIDIATRFANVDRHCGFAILYQSPSGGEFEVMRLESNFIDNATAEKIERQQTRAALDKIWAGLAANCPNY